MLKTKIEEMDTNNSNIDEKWIEEMEYKIKHNTLREDDLKKMNSYLNLTHPNFLTNLLRDNHIVDFKDYIEQRDKMVNRNPKIDDLRGYLLGILSYIQINLKNTK